MMQSMSSSNRRESIRQTSSPALMRLSPQWKNILKQKCLDRARQKRSNRIISNRRRGQSQSNSNSHSGSTSMSTSMSMTMTMDTGSTSVPLSPSLLPPIYPSLQTDKKSCNYIPNSSFPSESKNVARELVQEQLNATGVAIIPANSLLLAQSSSQFKTGNAMNMQPFQYREKTSTTKGATFVNPYLSNSHDAKVLQSQSQLQLQLQPQSHPSEHSIPSIQQQASGQDVDFITEEELNQLLWEVEQELDNEEEAFIAEEMRVIQEEEMREKRMMEEQILAFEEYMDHNTDNHNMSTDMMQ